MKDQIELFEKVIDKLSQVLPPTFSRQSVTKQVGDIVAVGTLANLAYKKQGPPYFIAKRQVMYEKESFLKWLRTYIWGPSDSDKSLTQEA